VISVDGESNETLVLDGEWLEKQRMSQPKARQPIASFKQAEWKEFEKRKKLFGGEPRRDRRDEALDRVAALLGVGRVQLGDRQRRQLRRGEQDLERGEGAGQRQPLVAAGVLGERRVGEVDDVDVEVDEQPLAAALERGERPGGRGGRVGGDLVDRDPFEPAALDRRPLELGCLLGSPAEQQHLLVAQQRRSRPDPDQLRAGARLGQHVGHPHPVERPLADRAGDVEVGVGVEVEEADVAAARQLPGDRPDPDRAVAAEDQGQRVGRISVAIR
jgi:hypothetical protein